MKKFVQKILFLLAVSIIVCHNIFPHTHHTEEIYSSHLHLHDEDGSTKHHHNNENSSDNQHGVLSFVQLEDNFIPSNRLVKNFEFPIEFTPLPASIILTDNFTVKTQTHFVINNEYPPPDIRKFTFSFRGPPVA